VRAFDACVDTVIIPAFINEFALACVLSIALKNDGFHLCMNQPVLVFGRLVNTHDINAGIAVMSIRTSRLKSTALITLAMWRKTIL